MSTMRVIHTGEALDRMYSVGERVIFLAGPTPREQRVKSWRPKALDLLKDYLFGGAVVVPEHPPTGAITKTPEEIYAWEWNCLREADVVAFWVPRHMQDFPGLTTNIEFGMYLRSGKVVLGAPKDACDMNYIRWACEELHVPCTTSLEATMHLAVLRASKSEAKTAPVPTGSGE